MRASILAVGTELTAGQITNRNAAWISKKLSDLGMQTSLHITVPDERVLILEALRLLESKSDFIFVTGGLGPTSDDFTRDLISEWAEQKLEFHEPSWKKIQDRLNSRGLPIGEFQKQQSYFPKGAQVLENSAGTANAFFLQKGKTQLWALPGPPNEIQAVWKDSISAQLTALTTNLDPYMTFSWNVLGLGEAQAPTFVEPVAQGLSGLDIGYRVNLPYLEIKLSFLKSKLGEYKKCVDQVDENLRPYTITRGGQDILDVLAPALTSKTFSVFDNVTGGVLLSRLQTVLKENFSYSSFEPSVRADRSLHCVFKNEKQFELELFENGISVFKTIIEVPSSFTSQMTERKRLYFTERALIEAANFWRK